MKNTEEKNEITKNESTKESISILFILVSQWPKEHLFEKLKLVLKYQKSFKSYEVEDILDLKLEDWKSICGTEDGILYSNRLNKLKEGIFEF